MRATTRFLSLSLGWLPIARAELVARWLGDVESKMTLDPVSLITLFLDSAEKALLDRTGDMTLLSCFGLFVHPNTAWNEYQTLQPGTGLTYYNPQKKITSTVEVRQVNAYLIALASNYRETGLIVRVIPPDTSRWWPHAFTREWMVVRPFFLIALVCFAVVCKDFVAIGAIGALLVGQSIAIVKSVTDGQIIDGQSSNMEEQTNIFFLTNRVTIAVKCKGDIFVKVMSIPRAQSWTGFQIPTTVLFMGGVLMVGFAGMIFKIAYLAIHAAQAFVLGIPNGGNSRRVIVNGAKWEVEETGKKLPKRRHAYEWASQQAGLSPGSETDWLELWNLATGETLEVVQKLMADRSETYDRARAEEGNAPTTLKPPVMENSANPSAVTIVVSQEVV